MWLFFSELPEVPPPHQKLAHTQFSAIHRAIVLNWHSPSVPWSHVLHRMEAIK